jgi:putative FmdB family regulatory protein
MPTYEYVCHDCGGHLEVVQSFRDSPLATCGTCGGRLRKVFSAAGIIFKGSGYYVTDSRKKATAAASSSKGDQAGTVKPSPESSNGSSSSTRSDTSPSAAESA